MVFYTQSVEGGRETDRQTDRQKVGEKDRSRSINKETEGRRGGG